jgi:hypothetical protein
MYRANSSKVIPVVTPASIPIKHGLLCHPTLRQHSTEQGLIKNTSYMCPDSLSPMLGRWFLQSHRSSRTKLKVSVSDVLEEYEDSGDHVRL